MKPFDPTKEVRYTDTRVDEQQRALSVKSCPVSMVLESTAGKSYLLNLIDCPGHVNFVDESVAAMRWVFASWIQPKMHTRLFCATK